FFSAKFTYDQNNQLMDKSVTFY
ncbi:TPA: DNA mismatch repair protein MutT, partial [Streptococcus pyogenes]|nr:DNA mismatch repair protein MutT [Streptococcus pyogenes]